MLHRKIIGIAHYCVKIHPEASISSDGVNTALIHDTRELVNGNQFCVEGEKIQRIFLSLCESSPNPIMNAKPVEYNLLSHRSMIFVLSAYLTK